MSIAEFEILSLQKILGLLTCRPSITVLGFNKPIRCWKTRERCIFWMLWARKDSNHQPSGLLPNSYMDMF